MYRNLMAEIARKGLSQAAFAKKVGISKNAFAGKIKSRTRFFYDEIVRIRREFPECDPDYLFEDDAETDNTEGIEVV